MKWFYNLLLVVQLILVIICLGFGWQADQAMDKSGIGSYDDWRKLNNTAATFFLSVAVIWMMVVVITILQRRFNLFQAQLAIVLPLLTLLIGWSFTVF